MPGCNRPQQTELCQLFKILTGWNSNPQRRHHDSNVDYFTVGQISNLLRYPYSISAYKYLMGVEPTPNAWKAFMLPLHHRYISTSGGIRTPKILFLRQAPIPFGYRCIKFGQYIQSSVDKISTPCTFLRANTVTASLHQLVKSSLTPNISFPNTDGRVCSRKPVSTQHLLNHTHS